MIPNLTTVGSLTRALPRLHKRTPKSVAASSRSPGGHLGRCPLCREFVSITPPTPAGDAPCPCCGQPIWPDELRWPIRADDGPLMPRPARIGLLARLSHWLRLGAESREMPKPGLVPDATLTPTGVWDRWLDG